MRVLIASLLLLAFAVADAPARAESPIVIVELADGSTLRGRVVAEDDEAIVLLSSSAGRIEILRTEIRSLREIDATDEQRPGRDPDVNTVFFTPTPETIGEGNRYFRNFLLFFLNAGFGVTDDLDISVGALFPISTELLSLSGGAKWRLLSRTEAPVGFALTANATVIEDYAFGFAGGVVGAGDDERSLNVAVGRSFTEDGDDDGLVFLVGADVRLGDSTKFLIEWGNSSDAIEDDGDAFAGLVNLGIRWHGERISASLTGLRPLLDAGDTLLFLPMTMVSVHF